MKNIITSILLFSIVLCVSAQSVYDSKINTIDGISIDFNDFKGKYILFVNVASNCGFTKQYKQLEELYQIYKSDLVVVGLPCNQFGGQEPSWGNYLVLNPKLYQYRLILFLALY